MKKIIIGNLKAYLSKSQINNLLKDINQNDNLIIAPQTHFLSEISEKHPNTKLASQDVSSIAKDFGAYTGETSALALKDIGITYSIIGHSERRSNLLENISTIKEKITSCLNAKITPIICIGESKEDRESGNYLSVISRELEEIKPNQKGDIIIAYEPIWAIGTGTTPSEEEIGEIISFLKENTKSLENNVFLVYGGSVNVDNAKAIISIAGIDGLLIGKASTDADELNAIMESII